MIKYEMRVYYRTPQLNEFTKIVQKLLPNIEQIEGCRVFPIEVAEPLTEEQIEKLKAMKKDWMDEIVIERVKG